MNLTELQRDLQLNKTKLCEVLEARGKAYYAIELHEEPGEVLITLLLSKEEIIESSIETCKTVFPDRKCSNVRVSECKRYITFEIE